MLRCITWTKKESLLSYFTHCNNRDSVKYIVSDMYEPYLLVQKAMFPKAKYVVNRFHYARYIMDALDKVRIRYQKSFGYNSKEYRLLKIKRMLVCLENIAMPLIGGLIHADIKISIM